MSGRSTDARGLLFEMLAENEELRIENEQLRRALCELREWVDDLLSERGQMFDELRSARDANLLGRRAQVKLWMQEAARRRGTRNSAQARAGLKQGHIELVLAVNDRRKRDAGISLADAVTRVRKQKGGGISAVREESLSLSRCRALVYEEWKKHGGRRCVTLPTEREQELRNALHALSHAQRSGGTA